MRRFFLILSLFLIGCNSSLERKDSTQYDKGSFNQLTKTDFDRMADYEIKENTESLRILALKFYKKNPAELRKTTSDSPEVTANMIGNLRKLTMPKEFKHLIKCLMRISKVTECCHLLPVYTLC
jgi:hypothetical protein